MTNRAATASLSTTSSPGGITPPRCCAEKHATIAMLPPWHASRAGIASGLGTSAAAAAVVTVADADRNGKPGQLERKHRGEREPHRASNPAPDLQANTAAGSGTRQNLQAGLRRSQHDAGDLQRCEVVWRLVSELFDAAFEPGLESSSAMARRRPRCHMRQIAIYVCHVVLSVPYGTIAAAFGRDRSTVAHSCAVVEDRRDDKVYDRFVERCERCVNAVFQPLGPVHDE